MGAPTLDYTPDSIARELTLRKLLQMGCSGLPRTDVVDCFHPSSKTISELIQVVAPDIDVKWPAPVNLRRRLMSKVAGYGPHDHASTRCHLRRLKASEAAAAGCPS